MTTLDKLPLDSVGKISALNCSGNIRRRMLDLGIVVGTKIKPVFRSPTGDPTAYEVRGTLLALRKEDASFIDVSI